VTFQQARPVLAALRHVLFTHLSAWDCEVHRLASLSQRSRRPQEIDRSKRRLKRRYSAGRPIDLNREARGALLDLKRGRILSEELGGQARVSAGQLDPSIRVCGGTKLDSRRKRGYTFAADARSSSMGLGTLARVE
jgi:hypothetical protein